MEMREALYQKTISEPVELEGVCLAGGNAEFAISKVCIEPAEVNTGLVYKVGNTRIPAHYENTLRLINNPWITHTLNGTKAFYTEHGTFTIRHPCDIDNAEIHLPDNGCFPILKGGDMELYEKLKGKVIPQDSPRIYHRCTERLDMLYEKNPYPRNIKIRITPIDSDDLIIRYNVYEEGRIPFGQAGFNFNTDDKTELLRAKSIADLRDEAIKNKIDEMIRQGFKEYLMNNFILFGENENRYAGIEIYSPTLDDLSLGPKYSIHKIKDAANDLFLDQKRKLGAIIEIWRGGHEAHLEWVRKLDEQKFWGPVKRSFLQK